MAPWLTRRMTLVFLFVFVLSMVVPFPSSSLAQDDATPEAPPTVIAEPPPVDVPPPEPTPLPSDPMQPTVPPETPPAAPVLRQASESPMVVGEEPPAETSSLTVVVFDGVLLEPIADAWVVVSDVSALVVTSGAADQNGVFRTGPVQEGDYTVEASANGYMTGSRVFNVNGAAEYQLHLDPAYDSGTLTVTVLDSSTDYPLVGAVVVVYDGSMNQVASGMSGIGGVFVTGELAGGYYLVEVSADGYFGGSDWVPVAGPIGHTSRLNPIPVSGVLTITVIDAASKASVTGATVTVYGVTTGTTDEQGVFVVGELPAGFYAGEVTAAGHLWTSFDAQIDGPTSVTISLDPILDGTLTVDVYNRDTSEPIESATVTIFEYWGHVLLAEGTTGAEGRFSTVVPGGEYAVEVSASGFSTGYSYPFVNGDTFIPVALDPLALPGILTLTVLVEGTSDPVPDAAVRIYDPGWTVVASGSTNELGQLVTQELSPAYYFIDVIKQGYENGINSARVNGDAAVTVTMRPVPAASLSLHVTDQSTGMPMPGINVTVNDGYSGFEVANGTTDVDGIATFGIPGGYYRIAASADGYYPYEGESHVFGPTDLYVTLEPRVSGEVTVQVIDTTWWKPLQGATVVITDVDTNEEVARGETGEDGIFLSGVLEGGNYNAVVEADGYAEGNAGFRVTGPQTVTLVIEREPGILTLHVTDAATGSPVAGATVILHSWYGEPYGGGITDADGYFVTNQLPGGAYLVEATAEGYVRGSVNVDVRGDAVAELAMEPTAPGVLTVTVLNEESGLPIRRAVVRVLREGSEIAVGETGKDGQFATDLLPSGQYEVRVTADGYDDGYAAPLVNGPTERTISLRPQLPGALSIQVVSEITGEPVGKASIVVYDTTGDVMASGKTSKTGEFRTRTLTEGEYIVDVSTPGFFPVRSWMWVRGDTNQVIGLTPQIDGTVTVTVVEMYTQVPIPGAIVTVIDHAMVEVASGATDQDGVYISEELGAGDYTVTVSAEGYLTTQGQYLRVSGDSALAISVERVIPGPLFVDVFAADTYERLSGATVVVRDAASGREVARGLTDEVGTFSTPELPGGDYLVRIIASGYASSSQQVWVNGYASLVVVLQPGEPLTPGVMTLTVSSVMSGTPINGALVHVIDVDKFEEVVAGETDASGVFATEELSAGEYIVRVEAQLHTTWISTITIDGSMDIAVMMDLLTSAKIVVVPYITQPGGKVTVTGEGFAPSEPVRIMWNGPDGRVLAEVKATKDGTISCTMKIPEDGGWSGAVVAVGLDSGAVGVGYVVFSTTSEPMLDP